MNDATKTVVLIEMSARADDEDVRTRFRANRTNRADVAFDGGFGESGDVGRGEFGDCLTDQIRGFTPTASESEGDVVLRNPRLFRDLGGGLSGHVLRVYGTVVERVPAAVRHGNSLERRATAHDGGLPAMEQ